ncbi:YybH family protein [Gilvimarinus sp. F26214L]|uniref:YybH family protein n=1 Tax=Gilvimarinus sp. DZF01 TaxID=3461371 RepID=UPI0040458DBF
MSSLSEHTEIEVLLRKLEKAHAGRSAAAITELYQPDAVIFDLAPPLGHRGIHRDGVEEWLASWDGPIGLTVSCMEITAHRDLAVVSAFNRIEGRQNGIEQDLWYRNTLTLRKTGDGWRIAHDHSSVPFYMDGSYRAAVDLQPHSSSLKPEFAK